MLPAGKGPGLEAAQATETASAEALRSAETDMQAWQSRWDGFNEEAGEASQTAEVEKAKIEQIETQIAQGCHVLYLESPTNPTTTVMDIARLCKAAHAAGATVIVTACPFCLVNMEDAIKVAGMEGKMEAIDLTELIAQHIQ